MTALGPKPYWDDTSLPEFPPLDRSFDVDVAVIGGGITGVTMACLLNGAGCRVALIERGRIGGVDTGSTTAHITPVLDTLLQDLASRHGRDQARAAWDAGWAALQQI